MKRMFIFLNRNIKEMLRDPIVYIFCLGFPLVMLGLFQIIHHYAAEDLPIFEAKSLVPGIMMFSFTFVMLQMALQVSKDQSTALLKRLYTSPLKSHEFILGYAILGFLVGLVQSLCCVLFGFIFACIGKDTYFSFGSAILLILSQLPILIIFVFLGILFGTILNDKSAPGICSILISAAGVLGGCWMPLDTMGGFKDFCNVLPFYPSVVLGRIVVGADTSLHEVYQMSDLSIVGIVSISICFIVSITLSIFFFKRQMTNSKK